MTIRHIIASLALFILALSAVAPAAAGTILGPSWG
jgi:hypothetical protein